MDKVIKLEHIKLAGDLLKREHAERVRLEKVASDAIQEKRAQKIAFREVELGISEPFKSFDDFQTKVASLRTENLEVLEKALERGYGNSQSFGELDVESNNRKNRNPLEHFVLTGELELD
jgi:hypothetical protein